MNDDRCGTAHREVSILCSLLDPQCYTGNCTGVVNNLPNSNDQGWAATHSYAGAYTTGAYPNMRWTDANDTGGAGDADLHGYIQDVNNVDQNQQGGPHVGDSPVVLADGSVHMYPYGYTCCGIGPNPAAVGDADTAVWQELWSYNRAENVSPPSD